MAFRYKKKFRKAFRSGRKPSFRGRRSKSTWKRSRLSKPRPLSGSAGMGDSLSRYDRSGRRLGFREKVRIAASASNTLMTQGAGRVYQTTQNTVTAFNLPFLQGKPSTQNGVTLADVATTIPSSGASTIFTLKSLSVKLELKNQTNQSTKLTIYDLETKEDIPVGSTNTPPVQSWGQSLLDTSSSVTATYATATATLAENCVTLPEAPFLHSGGRNNYLWKVARRTAVVLAPGKSHFHYLRCTNFSTLGEYRYQMSANLDSIKGITKWILVVCEGGIINDTSAGTAGRVSEGSFTVDYFWSSKLDYSWVTDSTTFLKNTTNSRDPPIGVAGNQNLVNELTGAVVTVAAA